jgi:hypothetical protein
MSFHLIDVATVNIITNASYNKYYLPTIMSSNSSSSFGAVTIPFDKWREACQRQKSLAGKENLRVEAAKLFSKLFSTTQIEAAKNVVLTTKSAHNQSLAQLI